MMLSSVFPQPAALHIPDGFLSIPIALIFWTVSALLIVLAVQRTRAELGERQIPLMGVMAAFIFAAQTINFPVAGGTSGHLLGGTLAAITLGPWAGMLVMTAVIGLQALMFQDGGLLVMGANIFNMGLITALIGYGLYRLSLGRGHRFRLTVAGAAAWLSVMAGALFTALQLWLSGTSRLNLVVPAMLGVHTVIGIGEALITVTALAFLLRLRPDIIATQRDRRGGLRWAFSGLVLALGVVLLSPVASLDPDGLERVAYNLGFDRLGANAPYQIFPDYSLPPLGDNHLSTILAGMLGVLVIAGLVLALAHLLRRKAL